MKLQSLHQFLYDKLLRQTIHVDLIQIVFDLALAAKLIGYNISRNKLLEVGRGNSGSNYTIKQPHPLNVLAGDIFKSYLEKSGQVICRLSSEISTKAVKDDKMQKASYTAFINPLDYDYPVDDLDSPGSIFSLYPHLDNRAAIKTGRIQKLAGYFLYGSTITLVLTLGEGVHVFSYDSHIGEFLLTQKNLKISKDATAYYLQKERQEEFPVEIQKYLNAIKSCQREDGSRYIRRTKPSLDFKYASMSYPWGNCSVSTDQKIPSWVTLADVLL